MSIPNESECKVCEQWGCVAGWDVHLPGYICVDCVKPILEAGALLTMCGFESPKYQMPLEER